MSIDLFMQLFTDINKGTNKKFIVKKMPIVHSIPLLQFSRQRTLYYYRKKKKKEEKERKNRKRVIKSHASLEDKSFL
jgi:hypothetical protein